MKNKTKELIDKIDLKYGWILIIILTYLLMYLVFFRQW